MTITTGDVSPTPKSPWKEWISEALAAACFTALLAVILSVGTIAQAVWS